MTCNLLDGSSTAKTIRRELAQRTARLRDQGIQPCLAVVLIGDDPASHTYVRMKQKACEAVGIRSVRRDLPADCTQQAAEALVAELNTDPTVHGILVQHPLPKHLDELAVLQQISTSRDVDGITPASMGHLVAGLPGYVSCTPLGIVELLDRYSIPISGKRAVVIGRSIILGKPMALLLLQRHATVTICHSRTQDLADVVRSGDIVVAAVGRPELITGDMIKPGAVVIDAGYNRVPGTSHDVGDVHFPSAAEKASWITPVPGGVGPMTIAMLLANTVTAAERTLG